MNYNPEKELNDSQRQTIDRMNDYEDNVDGEGNYNDEDRDNKSGGRASDKSADARDKTFDSRSNRDRSGSALRKMRRSETVHRVYNRTLTNESRSAA